MNEEMSNEVEAKVVRALERRPDIAVPVDFAARVARAMPEKKHSRAQAKPVFGRLAGYLAVVATLAALLLLARTHPEAIEAGEGFLFVVELLLVAQLLVVGWWLGVRRDGLG